MNRDLEDRKALHIDFWEGKELKRPRVAFRIGDFFGADALRHLNIY